MVRECGRAWSLRARKDGQGIGVVRAAAASSGARRRAKVRQSGEVDPGGEDAPPRTARAAIFRECAGKSEPAPRSLGILDIRHAPAASLRPIRFSITVRGDKKR